MDVRSYFPLYMVFVATALHTCAAFGPAHADVFLAQSSWYSWYSGSLNMKVGSTKFVFERPLADVAVIHPHSASCGPRSDVSFPAKSMVQFAMEHSAYSPSHQGQAPAGGDEALFLKCV